MFSVPFKLPSQSNLFPVDPDSTPGIRSPWGDCLKCSFPLQLKPPESEGGWLGSSILREFSRCFLKLSTTILENEDPILEEINLTHCNKDARKSWEEGIPASSPVPFPGS